MPACGGAIAVAARNIRHVARRQVPRGWTARPVAGVTIEQRVTPLERVGCYVPGGRYPLPSSLLMTAIPARVAGVREIVAVCPRPDPTVMARGARGGRDAAAPARRRARDRRARLRHGQRSRASTRSSAPATPTWRRRRRWWRPTARSTSSPGRARSWSSRPAASRRGLPPTCSRRPSTTRMRGRSW